MRRLCFALLFLASLPLRAASFDCSKASSAAEKMICKTPRLSALDDELARDYARARQMSADPAALKRAQQDWIVKGRDAQAEYAASIEAAYLARIAELRLANRSLFARTPAPASIFGRYSHSEPLCLVIPGTNDYECGDEVESFIEVRRGSGNEVAMNSQLMFFNGHECNAEGTGEWSGDELRVPVEFEESRCVLIVRFTNGKAMTDDPAGNCRSYLCGARGGFHNISLPKEGTKRRASPRKH